jgi:flagellar hook assembly protein FlgD
MELTVCDITGRVVKTLFSGTINPGAHHLEWDGRNSAGEIVSSGIYFIRLETPQFKQIRRTVFLK